MNNDMRAGIVLGHDAQWTEKERADLARWVVAMRRAHAAGTPQTKDHLRTPDGYCCLGLWCVVAESRGVLQSRDLIRGSFTQWSSVDSAWEDGNLPLGAWLARTSNPDLIYGLMPRDCDDDSDDPEDAPDAESVNAAEANDYLKLTFAQIADLAVWSYGITPEELAAAELEPWVPEIEGPEPEK